MKRVGEKNKKIAIARKRAAKTKSQQDEEKREKERSADEPDPEEHHADRRSRNFPPTTSYPHTPAAAEPLRRGGGDLGSHTSP